MTTQLTEKVLDKIGLAEDQQQLVLWDAEIAGFAAVIGKKRTTFVLEYRAIDPDTRLKVKRRQVIGRRGEVVQVPTRPHHHAPGTMELGG